jgi:hypothetical protein
VWWLLLLSLQTPSEVRETVAPGIEYGERRSTGAAGEPFALQWLEIDPANPAVNIVPMRAAGRAAGRERPTDMARRWGATAVVNAGYFVVSGPYGGASTGVYLWNGEPVSGGAGRTALLLCEEEGGRERWEIDVVDFRGRALASGAPPVAIAGLNRMRSAAEDLILYTARLGPSTLTATEGAEAALDARGAVLRLEDGLGNAEIPPGGSVLSGTGAAAEWLRAHSRPGRTVKVETAFEPRRPGACRAPGIVGAGPRLVSAGQADVTDEKFAHAPARNPRTAAAITKAGKLLLVTLDGRQKHSVGMRLDEFAETLIGMGAQEAVNLDGGGSTVLATRGRIRNSPSDGSERPVSDALLIYSVPGGEELAALVETLAAEVKWPPPEAAARLAALARRGAREEFLRTVENLDGAPGPAQAILLEAARGAH